MTTIAVVNPQIQKIESGQAPSNVFSSCHLNAITAHRFSPAIIKNTTRSPSSPIKEFNAKASPYPQLEYAVEHHPESKQLVAKILKESNTTELKKATATLPDIFLLFIYLMQLSIKSRSQEFMNACEERLEQLKVMEEVVKSYKDQSKWSARVGLSTGLLTIAAGTIPLVGNMGGPAILGQLSQIFPSLQGMDPKDAFKALTKITEAMSQMQQNTGSTYEAFVSGERHFLNTQEDLHKDEANQAETLMQEKSREFDSFESVWQQILQAQHEVVRQLYN